MTADGLTKQEREEMCIALSATQESALIQLLLEICLPTQEDKEVRRDKGCLFAGSIGEMLCRTLGGAESL